ncbi:AraC family transcriptional regulator [Sorangium sp. So ce1151]|uniref:AraC family transcriptional regulator n=1 Tax=Sorangium sp. So ce1151 TaxID=3133332 RepID=UPI003F5F7F4D
MGPTGCIKSIRLCVLTASRAGVDPREALAAAEVDPALLEDPTARVPHDTVARAWTRIPELARDPAFGLHAAELLVGQLFDVVDFVTDQCGTVREVIGCVLRYQRLIHDAVDVRLTVEGARARISQRFAGAAAPPQLSSFIMGLWVLRARVLTGVPFAPHRVTFAHPAPADRREYDRLLAVPLGFDADENAVLFDASFLDTPTVRSDPALGAVLRRHADELLARLPAEPSVRGALERHLIEALGRGVPDVAAAARALGMSARTLQRRLGDEGESYKSVLDEARRKLAVAHMRERGRTVSEVAFLLGFSEVSAFSRAFRRWTGHSPAAYRRAG